AFFETDSAGTASYHIGKGADSRTISAVERMGVRINHRARQVRKEDLRYYDYILAMDVHNKRMLQTLAAADQELGGRLYLMRDFEPTNSAKSTENTVGEVNSANARHVPSETLSVPDPYYGGEEGFDEVYEILDRSLENFISFVCRQHKLPPHV
ncbi:MAG: low molecular weight phosphotyrosine protein phosphatase, partial [Bacteroidetes bacterium]|nr:low molecular weight phosphotyrosine protein phosphatase [Bacteroidota bacterium]